jgi:hypothetical protein
VVGIGQRPVLRAARAIMHSAPASIAGEHDDLSAGQRARAVISLLASRRVIARLLASDA